MFLDSAIELFLNITIVNIDSLQHVEITPFPQKLEAVTASGKVTLYPMHDTPFSFQLFRHIDIIQTSSFKCLPFALLPKKIFFLLLSHQILVHDESKSSGATRAIQVLKVFLISE